MVKFKFITTFCIVFIFISCHETKYATKDQSFNNIYLRGWNSTRCPSKIVFEKYEKKSNFKNLIDSTSGFDININCLPKYDKFNNIIPTSPYNDQMILTPYVPYNGKINYDIKLVIDDSLVYKITDIKDGIDTVSARSGPGKWIIMNNIKSLVVNGKKLDNKNTPLSIEIPTKLGKVIKKK
jgi:hypothetical protein